MADLYSIFVIRSDSKELVEQLGSKPKFWFRLEGDTQPWLFKYTREKTGEHWSEKVAAEIAKLIELPASTVELADFMGKRGSASRSFVRRREGFDLVHGDELLAGHVFGYERDRVFRHSSHSIQNIIEAVTKIFPDETQRHAQLCRLAGFIVLDALIGNTDRHHQNWGLLRRKSGDGMIEQEIAPSFDHASSLGRNESDERLERHLREGTVLNYARKGRGGIFWTASDARGANPLDLAEKAARRWPHYFQPWLQKLRGLSDRDFLAIVNRVPSDWMSDPQKRFCLTFLSCTCSELKKLPP